MVVVRVLEKHCKGCGLCVEFCPRDVLEISGDINELGIRVALPRPDAECTACKSCVAMCPDAAIELEEVS